MLLALWRTGALTTCARPAPPARPAAPERQRSAGLPMHVYTTSSTSIESRQGILHTHVLDTSFNDYSRVSSAHDKHRDGLSAKIQHTRRYTHIVPQQSNEGQDLSCLTCSIRIVTVHYRISLTSILACHSEHYYAHLCDFGSSHTAELRCILHDHGTT